MTDSFFLSLREGVRITPRGSDQAVLQYGPWSSTFSRMSSGTLAALQRLGGKGEYEDQLTEVVLKVDGTEALANFYYYLHFLGQRGLLRRSVCLNGEKLASLVPASSYFDYASRSINPESQYLLSRFAYTHVEDGETRLESPLSYARIFLHDWRAAMLVHALARPRRVEELGKHMDGLPAAAVEQLLTLLINARMLSGVNDAGRPVEDENPSLRSWEFHDLLFHSRSRIGRHDHPAGGTYRFAGLSAPPPALKPADSSNPIALYCPDLEQRKREDPPFALVQETRRSIREYDTRPITLQQLGEFLYRVGRVTERWEKEVPIPGGQIGMDFARRPYPGGGALYELELYVAVNACENLAEGLYHYDPQKHRLEPISGLTSEVNGLLYGASQATTIPKEQLQVLIFIATRFQRIAWKYASIAYSITLKHVGVVYQTMYLVATAMELAPCGVGCGDSDLFSRAAGTDYYEETSVGEFLLGSKCATSSDTV